MGIESVRYAAQVRQGETIPAAFRLDAFHCIFCVVYAPHSWRTLKEPPRPETNHQQIPSSVSVCTCENCQMESYWFLRHDGQGVLIQPNRSQLAPPPTADLPAEVRPDYEEAASIVEASPRGAAALLRLALQKLMPHLGESGGTINADIASLVSKGLEPGIQQALDALRVVGNNAVHPGELDLQDDVATAVALFGLINYIVEQRISHPKQLQKLYDGLPAGAREAIAQRDGHATTTSA